MAQPFSEQAEAELSGPPIGSNDCHLWGVAGSKDKRAAEREGSAMVHPRSTINPRRDDPITTQFCLHVGW